MVFLSTRNPKIIILNHCLNAIKHNLAVSPNEKRFLVEEGKLECRNGSSGFSSKDCLDESGHPSHSYWWEFHMRQVSKANGTRSNPQVATLGVNCTSISKQMQHVRQRRNLVKTCSCSRNSTQRSPKIDISSTFSKAVMVRVV